MVGKYPQQEAVQTDWGKFIFPISIVILGLFTFYTGDIRVTWDLSWHMDEALNLYKGHGIETTDLVPAFKKGPLWPFMIYLVYQIAGISVWNVFWLIRIFAVLNPVLIYFLGKTLYGNRWIGFSAALLVLSSYSVNYWSYRHLDAVWPAFAIAAMIAGFCALERESIFLFIISGVCISLSYLVKQSAFLLMPLPVMMVVFRRDYRSRTIFFGLLAYMTAVVLLVSPWPLYVYSETKNIKLALLGSGSKDLGIVSPDAFQFIGNYLAGLVDYYSNGSNSLRSNFLLAPLFVIAWGYTVFRAFRKDKGVLFLNISFLLLSPYIAEVGGRNLRVGQLIIFLLLTYLALSGFCLDFVRRVLRFLCKQEERSKLIQNAFGILVIGFLVFLQIFWSHERDKGGRIFFERSVVYHLLGPEREVSWKIDGWFDEPCFNEVVQKLSEINNIEDGIMVDRLNYARALHLKLEGDRPVFRCPILRIGKEKVSVGEAPLASDERPLWVHSNNIEPDPKFHVYMLFETQLMEKIKKNAIKFILVTPGFWQLNEYFSRSPAFEEMETCSRKKGSKQVYRVYRVLGFDTLGNSFEPVFSNVFKRNMAKWKSKDPQNYERFRDKYIYGLASISPDKFKDIELAFE